ncbi:UNVERIFIED_CONTAM: hypothetical protein HDU68_006236 [Siphonaria sp. JEL0065]|nr:hypothetical protein HDU68_006236 [Siphonaria sp. JEL0065]
MAVASSYLVKQNCLKVKQFRPSLPLPVATSGLAANGVALVKNAVANNVKIDIVNIMIMDYYQSIPYVDSNGKSLMGQYGIQATQATFNQVGSLVGSIGMCAMIGINDDAKEVFTLADATQVANFASATSYVSWVSFWVVGADVDGNSDGKSAASGAFAKVFIAGLSDSAGSSTTTTTTQTQTTTTTTTVKPTTTPTTVATTWTTTTTLKPSSSTTPLPRPPPTRLHPRQPPLLKPRLQQPLKVLAVTLLELHARPMVFGLVPTLSFAPMDPPAP